MVRIRSLFDLESLIKRSIEAGADIVKVDFEEGTSIQQLGAISEFLKSRPNVNPVLRFENPDRFILKAKQNLSRAAEKKLNSLEQFHHELLGSHTATVEAIEKLRNQKMKFDSDISVLQASISGNSMKIKGEHFIFYVGRQEAKELLAEGAPIWKIPTEEVFQLGRKIAISRLFVCSSSKNVIWTYDRTTAKRCLLRGHTKRVSDIVFCDEDVHLLASASVDGDFFVWKIDEGSNESDKPQITGKIVIALHIVSEEESLHPRVCWHNHKQDVLVIGIGSNVLKIDTIKVGKGKSFSAEEPLKCAIEKLVDGVQFVGKHDAPVTDLSMSQWMTTCLVSASKDGTIKIWEDRKAVPLVTLKPHDGHPVDSVAFLKAPHRSDHIVLVTAGPLNREVKIWTSTNQEGWLLPSDSESLVCTQTLELRNSSEPHVEDAFFNQVVVLPQASLILLANAKRNAIYAAHIDYGPNPASTRIDCISEFTVTTPILSLTGISKCLSDTEQVAQVYCVQTLAIQQYAIDLSQCLPPPLDSGSQATLLIEILAVSPLLKSDLPVNGSESTTAARDTTFSNTMEELASLNTENKALTPLSSSNADVDHLSSPSVLSPDVPGGYLDSKTSSKEIEQGSPFRDFAKQSRSILAFDHMAADQSNEGKIQGADSNFASKDARCGSNDIAVVQNSAGLLKASNNVMHLVTPSEIKSGIVMPYESSSFRQEESEEAVRNVEANKDIENVEVEVKVVGKSGVRHNGSGSQKDLKALLTEKKETLLNSETVESNNETTKEYLAITADVLGQAVLFDESTSSQFLAMQETLNEHVLQQKIQYDEIISMLKEMHKQISVCASISKETTRLEASLVCNMEKSNNANADAITARFQEDNSKLEKYIVQQIANLMTTYTSKELFSMFDRSLKNKLATVGQVVARAITPLIEKSLSHVIAESFQSVSTKLDRTVSTKLEVTVARQIQAQFQMSGQQALQEELRSTVESLVVPAFERLCKAMFKQVDATFQKGMSEYTGAFQMQFESSHTPLALSLNDAISSVTSITQSFNTELAVGLQKLLALAASSNQNQ